MITEQVAPVLAAFAGIYGDTMDHVVPLTGKMGTPDGEIPALCRREQVDTLISVNVKDFGARKVYFQALLDSGINAVILRAPKQQFNINLQVSFITGHYTSIKKMLIAATEPTLLSLTHSGVRERSLKELSEELEVGRRLP